MSNISIMPHSKSLRNFHNAFQLKRFNPNCAYFAPDTLAKKMLFHFINCTQSKSQITIRIMPKVSEIWRFQQRALTNSLRFSAALDFSPTCGYLSQFSTRQLNYELISSDYEQRLASQRDLFKDTTLYEGKYEMKEEDKKPAPIEPVFRLVGQHSISWT